MADLEKTVSIIFKATDDMSAGLKSMSRSIDTFAGDIQGATQPLADLAANILKVEAALTAMALGGLAYSVKAAGDFNDSFNEISTLIDGTGEGFERFKGQILDYATTSTASIDDVNRAVYSAISAGVEYTKSLEVLTVAEKLSTAGKAELEPTIRALVSTLNAYGESTDQAGQYADVFFKTVKLGQTTLPELSTSLAQVTSIAKTAGVPFETIAAAIADLTAKGAPTADAITRIKSALVAIIKPSEKAIKAANDLGIDFSVAAIKSKGFEVVLKEIHEATGGSAEEMVKLFGRVEGLNAALILGADAGGSFSSKLAEMRDAAGAVDVAFEKMSDNLELVFQNLLNNIEAVLIDIGTPMLDETVEIARAMSDIFKGIRVGLDAGAFDSVFTALEKFGTAIAKDLRKIAEIMPEALGMVDFDGLIAAFENLAGKVGGSFKALFGDIDLTTPEGLSDAIQLVIDSVTALTNISAGIVAQWEPIIEILGKAIEKFSKVDESTSSWIGNLLGTFQVINKLTGILGGLSTGLGAVASALTSMAAVRYLFIGTGLKAVAGWIGTIALSLAPFAIGGSIIVGLLYILDKLAELHAGKPPKIEIETGFKTSEGHWFDFETGEIRTSPTGNVITFGWEEKEPPQSESEIMQELLDSGLTEVQIPYVMKYVEDPSVKNLDAAVKAIAGDIVKSVDKVVIDLKELPKKIEPMELIKIDKSMIETELAEIKTQAEIVQTAMEWTAMLDIAEVEAGAKVMQAAFEASAVTVAALAESTADMVGILAGVDTSKGFGVYWDILEFAEKQQAMEQQALDNQIKLTGAQIALMEAQTEARKRGDALITINGEGLQPHLEAFMWEIIGAVQITASEEGAEFLLGVGNV